MKYSKILTIIFLLAIFNACNEEYLERFPLDEISTMDYWKTPGDLELYMNQFYPVAFNEDRGMDLGTIFKAERASDNVIHVSADVRLMGTRVVPGSGGWNYTTIRDINYFLEHYQTVEEDFEKYKQYVGEAHFFRAFFYFNLVKEYGDVPLIDKVLNQVSEELYLPATSRNQVIDFIIKDLDKAIEYLPTGIFSEKKRLNTATALLFKSRVCLYEGTWEKYHSGDPFGVDNPAPEKYLNLAVQSSQEVINSGLYRLYSIGKPKLNYFFFGNVNHGTNAEVIFWKQYDFKNLGYGNAYQYELGKGQGGGMGLTKNLVNSYLCTDGRPIYLSDGNLNPLYKGDGNLLDEAANRDPRLTTTMFTPGFPIEISGSDTLKFVRPAIELNNQLKCSSGYQICKRLNWDPAHHTSGASTNDGWTGVIIFRYAEALLNYAEAKAELGTITQNDINISIKLLRDRVGMPNLVISEIQTDPKWQFPQLSPVINEIRRERRVELVLEGFRWDDIARWAAADEVVVGKRYIGAKFNSVNYPNFSPKNYMLTEDMYIDPLKNQLPAGNGFVIGRDYLNPISTQELTLNPSLAQNPGW